MIKRLSLRTRTGEYVRAEGPSGELRVPPAGAPDAAETFTLTDLGKNQVRLQASSGRYVSAEGGGGGLVTAYRSAGSKWETFQRAAAAGGKISLRCANGTYLCAEGGGGDLLLANRSAAGDWESFTVVDVGRGKIALRANGGQFVRAEAGGGRLVVNRQELRALETFEMDDATYPGRVTLRAANDKYVTAENGGGGRVHADRRTVDGLWETFKRTKDPAGDRVWLQSDDGRYLQQQSGDGAAVVSGGAQAGDWETFHEVAVGDRPRPGKLLVYYGFPSLVNGGAATDLAPAARVFAHYEYVIFGAGIEIAKTEGTVEKHDDHDNTVTIIQLIATMSSVTKVFGYIPLGTSTSYTTDEVARRAGLWRDMGVHGILLDEFGYDLIAGADTTARRKRQNDVVDGVHGLGLPVIANGWKPEDLFNTGDGKVSLDARDFYFCESFQISEAGRPAQTVVQPSDRWRTKADKLRGYQQQIGFRVLSTSRTAAVTDASGAEVLVAFDDGQLRYAWYSALLDGHEAFGWGEPHFCASGPAMNAAPFRARPGLAPRWFTGALKPSADVARLGAYERGSDAGTIWVKPSDQSVGP